MIHIWRPWKLSNFQDHLTPLSIYVQITSTHLTLHVQFQTKPPLSLQMISNQLKENIISKDDYYMLSGPSFRSAFVFSINSLILSGFPLTYFHLAEPSLSGFSWLYTFVWAVARKILRNVFYLLLLFTFLVLILQSTCFICTTWKRKQTIENQPHRTYEQNQNKTKTKSGHIQIGHVFYYSI